MEPSNRFTNRLTALLRMDRSGYGREGTFTVEAPGPGYDVAALTRSGIAPQVTVPADADWSAYSGLWWSALHLVADPSPGAEDARRKARLTRIAADILTDTGHLTCLVMTSDEQAAAAEAWLRERGFDHLWRQHDIAAAVARRAPRRFDNAFLIAARHPRRGLTRLATATPAPHK